MTCCLACELLPMGMVTATLIAATALGAPAHVVDCHDADTCKFTIGLGLGVFKIENVRFCDVDAPELEEGESAARARRMVLMLLRSAETLDIVPSGGMYKPRRSFARLLAWVIVDGVDIGQLLIAGGLAKQSEKRCKR